MKKKIIIIVVVLLLTVALILVSKMIEKNSPNYDIEKIIESNIIFRIDENYYGPDIDLYSSRDEDGNEWIYRRTSNHIVLTEDGILCKYTRGSYRQEIQYSGYNITKTIKLSNMQVEEISKKIEELTSVEFNMSEGNTEYRITQENNSKSVKRDSLNNILDVYGFDI